MKSEDMKMKKYEILIRDIDKYLGPTGLSPDSLHISPLDFILKKDDKNPWIENIFVNSFQVRGIGIGNFKKRCVYLENIDKNDVIQFLEQIRKCNNCNNNLNPTTGLISKTISGGINHNHWCSIPNHLMFWLIFIVSVDNENYNNNLSVVSDVAYVLDFDEEKLSDWITAVKGVLAGKKLWELDYKTEEGKNFFLRENGGN